MCDDAKMSPEYLPGGYCHTEPGTQKKINGKADNLVTFFRFLAEDIREYLAELGIKDLTI